MHYYVICPNRIFAMPSIRFVQCYVCESFAFILFAFVVLTENHLTLGWSIGLTSTKLYCNCNIFYCYRLPLLLLLVNFPKPSQNQSRKKKSKLMVINDVRIAAEMCLFSLHGRNKRQMQMHQTGSNDLFAIIINYANR